MSATKLSTEYGAISTGKRDGGGLSIAADGFQLRAWANRPESRWPCSTLARLDSIEIDLAPNGDLVDIECEPAHHVEEIAADELLAWQDDVLWTHADVFSRIASGNARERLSEAGII